MDISTAAQLAAVYAEAAVAFVETGAPQVVIWLDDEQRWDFISGDEAFEERGVVFVLQEGWDGQLTLEAITDVDDDRYNGAVLAEEVARQMDEEGMAKALIENILELRRRREEGELDEAPPADREDDET